MSTTTESETQESIEAENAITTFEAVERRLTELQEEGRRLDGEFVKLRNQAEKIVAEIGAANERAESELENYRGCLHDGEKAEANAALERVSKQRVAIKNLRKSLGDVLPRLGEIHREAEAVRVVACDAVQLKFFADFQLRLRDVSAMPSRVLAAAGHTETGIDKLSEYVRKNSL